MNPARLVILLIWSGLSCLCAEVGATVRASAQLSNAIAAGLPRFNPLPVDSPRIEEPPDLISLPPFVVEASRIPNLPEPDLLTKAGMEALLRKRYPGASLPGQNPTMSGSAPNYAALMYRDDLRLKHMADFGRALDSAVIAGDLAGAKELKAELQDIFMRSEDWRTEGMDKSVNHWRR
jgi:hypothetical protein